MPPLIYTLLVPVPVLRTRTNVLYLSLLLVYGSATLPGTKIMGKLYSILRRSAARKSHLPGLSLFLFLIGLKYFSNVLVVLKCGTGTKMWAHTVRSQKVVPKDTLKLELFPSSSSKIISLLPTTKKSAGT